MNRNSPDLPHSYADHIDLARHGFIGASAGTGKTHTIVYLVLKILHAYFLSSDSDGSERGIESILVLTYTEKAASELRSRIRHGIKERVRVLEAGLSAEPGLERERKYFLEQLGRLDQATIATIHGFCNKILKEYALETGTPSDPKLVPEEEPLRRLLDSHLRSEFAEELPPESLVLTLLELRKSFDNGFTGDTWEGFLAEIAGKKEASPDSTFFLPDPFSGSFPDEEKIRNVFQSLNEEYGGLKVSQEALLKSLHASTRKALAERQIAFESILKNATAALDPFREEELTKAILEIGRLKRKDSGIGSILLSDEELTKSGSDPAAEKYRNCREGVRKSLVPLENLATLFVVKIAEKIVKETPFEKNGSGEITYNDMIRNLSRSISDNSDLLSELKRRFDYAIVDEFQDTDWSQFSIFKTVFLEENSDSERTRNRLFLIGDPKQAIYGFRGADIGTYLAARAYMDKGGAFSSVSTVYPELDTNRRSLPELVSSYNDLFSAGGEAWFPISEPGFEPIRYSKVQAASEGGKAVLYSDKSGRGALNAFALPVGSNKQGLREPYAKFVVSEILHLVSPETEISIRKEKQNKQSYPGKVEFGDIAILVRNQEDSRELENYLKIAGIPYSNIRKRGLFSSNEAFRCRQILSCIEDEGLPDSFYKLLLSDLFEIAPDRLHLYAEYSLESEEKRRIESWRRFARKKDFPALFRSLSTESLLARPRDSEMTLEWERRIANFKQIFSLLTEMASENDLSLREIIDWMDAKISAEAGVEKDESLSRETEEDRVKILTIHSSKGLEFPFVFLMGGFSGWSLVHRKYYEYRETVSANGSEPKSRKILDLTKEHPEKYLTYLKNEDKRLYYVAVTRAMYKFYFPLLSEPSSDRPLELFRSSFEKIAERPSSTSHISKIFWNEEKRKYSVETLSGVPTEKKTSVALEPLASEQEPTRSPLPWPRNCERRRIRMESYSSLDRFLNPPEIRFGSESELFRMDEEIPVSLPSGELPSSNRMGNLLHHLLETLEFSLFYRAENPFHLNEPRATDVKKLLREYGFGKDDQERQVFAEKILAMLWNTLRSPLPQIPSLDCLAALPPSERKHEVDFFLKLSTGRSEKEEFLNGTVDLIFFSEGKYWILDWKSNRLESSSYSETDLKRKVEEVYSLQLALYSLVLNEWLKARFGDEYDRNLLGGMYFLFLRGMDPNRSDSGIFFQKIDPEFVESSRFTVLDALERKHSEKGIRL
ncbi:exodeoxyribonuclease V subunit beta [Leptospira fluminis]|uniref:RecBCD enzyme subunit RecB n=1 Tax=Leptospira fluminis TaxID=2484979 RepID=A0A4R9GRR5_9LEPT|nr:UvrD-helicase domain-containing protein [Leptospira fluminis]TGK20031.1 exodeoxyribonuclease V subunit beta [Leptospira fluminis]